MAATGTGVNVSHRYHRNNTCEQPLACARSLYEICILTIPSPGPPMGRTSIRHLLRLLTPIRHPDLRPQSRHTA